jgi:hypothetical protein
VILRAYSDSSGHNSGQADAIVTLAGLCASDDVWPLVETAWGRSLDALNLRAWHTADLHHHMKGGGTFRRAAAGLLGLLAAFRDAPLRSYAVSVPLRDHRAAREAFETSFFRSSQATGCFFTSTRTKASIAIYSLGGGRQDSAGNRGRGRSKTCSKPTQRGRAPFKRPTCLRGPAIDFTPRDGYRRHGARRSKAAWTSPQSPRYRLVRTPSYMTVRPSSLATVTAGLGWAHGGAKMSARCVGGGVSRGLAAAPSRTQVKRGTLRAGRTAADPNGNLSRWPS